MAVSALQIRRPEVIADIRNLADLTGVSLTEAVANAVRSQLDLERKKSEAASNARNRKADEILHKIWAMPRVGPDITDDDLYDADGLPK